MKNCVKVAIVVLLAVAVAAAFALRGRKRAEYVAVPEQSATVAQVTRGVPSVTSAPAPAQIPVTTTTSAPVGTVSPSVPSAVAAASKPRLLEIGSNRCMACLEMAKVLEALRASQGARVQVDFADIFEQPAVADSHKVSMIPTQILFDAAGREIFRHTGYFSHDDILAKFRELGVRI